MVRLVDGAPIYPLLGSRKAELIIGVKVEDVGVVGVDGGFVVQERGHFESGEARSLGVCIQRHRRKCYWMSNVLKWVQCCRGGKFDEG